jgi:hypothetical protein
VLSLLKSTPTISSPIEGEGKNGNSRERLQKINIWNILTKIRDPFGELPGKDEIELRRQLQAARQRVHTLEKAFQGSKEIMPAFGRAKRDLAECRHRAPRGHTPSFIALCLWFGLTLAPLVFALPTLVEVWETPNHWYLQAYRPFSADLWLGWQTITDSRGSAFIPIAILVAAWLVQRKLPRWHARTFIKTAAIVETLFFIIVGCSLLNLLHLPLIR